MTVLIQRVETISKVVYRPYLVRRKKFLWWTIEKYFSIQMWDDGTFIDPELAALAGGPSVECETEEEARETAEAYIKFTLELSEKEEFGTKISTQSEFLFIDEKTGDISFREIRPIK